MRERYWNFYVATKHKSFYYMQFQLLFVRINWILSAFLTLTTISCIAAWNVWQSHTLIWGFLIACSQIVQALFPKLPYNDILISTKFIITEVDRLLLDIDHDWLYLDIHNLSDDEILVLLTKHQQRYFDLVNQFFSGTYLPVIKYCEKRAERDCKNFFSTTYQI